MSTGQKSKPSYVYAIIGVSLVLFLLGTLGWLVINGRGLTRTFKEDIEVQVILHDNTRPEMADRLKGILDTQPFVREASITTKEEAAKDFEKEWGEDFTQQYKYKSNEAYYTFVALDPHSKPRAVPPVSPETEEETKEMSIAGAYSSERLDCLSVGDHRSRSSS